MGVGALILEVLKGKGQKFWGPVACWRVFLGTGGNRLFQNFPPWVLKTTTIPLTRPALSTPLRHHLAFVHGGFRPPLVAHRFLPTLVFRQPTLLAPRALHDSHGRPLSILTAGRSHSVALALIPPSGVYVTRLRCSSDSTQSKRSFVLGTEGGKLESRRLGPCRAASPARTRYWTIVNHIRRTPAVVCRGNPSSNPGCFGCQPKPLVTPLLSMPFAGIRS